jgi:4-hydroxybenzoate polyprenyltransferase
VTKPPEVHRAGARVPPLLRAAHLGPSLAVTCVVMLLAVGQDLPPYRAVAVTAAVLAGQLTIGWGNDLLDADRDRLSGRVDKPLANGELTTAVVRVSLAAAGLACIVLSLLVGWRSALVHLGLGVGSGHAYNLYFKRTRWSWLPYAVAFGTLPAVVSLADVPPRWAPAWMMAAAAALGVAAHFLNTLPDFDTDAVTGVRGLPHRLGRTATRTIATVLLVVASVTAVVGPPGAPGPQAWTALTIVAVLAAVAATGRGRTPFLAAIAIALVDVALLTVVAG